MPADDAAADWLVDTFAPSAQHWPALGAGQLDELRGALQLLHSHAPFGAEGAPALAGWSQQLQQLARSGIPDVRWTACCLLGATARAAHPASFQAHSASWLSVLLPLTKPSEPAAVQSIAAGAATDILARCQGGAHLARIDASSALGRVLPALAALRQNSQYQAEALKATFALLRAGGNPVRPFAAEIEQSCAVLLGSGSEGVRHSAALCLASVPGITATPKDDYADWLTLIRKLADELRSLLDKWLPVSSNAGHSRGAQQGSAGGPVEDGTAAVRRANGLCVAIGSMLHTPFVRAPCHPGLPRVWKTQLIPVTGRGAGWLGAGSAGRITAADCARAACEPAGGARRGGHRRSVAPAPRRGAAAVGCCGKRGWSADFAVRCVPGGDAARCCLSLG